MALIQFTRLDYGARIIFRYGQFDICATNNDCWMQGFFEIDGKIHGDKEIDSIIEALDNAWKEHERLAKEKNFTFETKFERFDIEGGTQEHPKLGNVAAFKSSNNAIKIKAQKKVTTITAEGFRIVSRYHQGAVTQSLLALREAREFCRWTVKGLEDAKI